MTSNPAVRADVENTFERDLTPGEARVVQGWLDQAWTILTATIPGLDIRLTTGDVARSAVVQVLTAMVERKLRNPDGLRSWDGDDYRETIDSTLSSGQLVPLPAEIARLTDHTRTRQGVYSLGFG